MERLLVDSRLKYYNKSLKDQINNLELEIYSLEGADLVWLIGYLVNGL
jgi:hypothetical protein